MVGCGACQAVGLLLTQLCSDQLMQLHVCMKDCSRGTMVFLASHISMVYSMIISNIACWHSRHCMPTPASYRMLLCVLVMFALSAWCSTYLCCCRAFRKQQPGKLARQWSIPQCYSFSINLQLGTAHPAGAHVPGLRLQMTRWALCRTCTACNAQQCALGMQQCGLHCNTLH